MCGIAGIFRGSSFGRGAPELLEQMGATLKHRGPDDGGVWIELNSGIGLAHRRLSIFDLSFQGKQPMISHCGRYVLCYNGEIYNHNELRRVLELEQRHSFRGKSDTEVLLAAISYWGLDAALERMTGMFAFALWDREERVLRLARDRMGEKPLYYGWAGHDFIFASELKALRIVPGLAMDVDKAALTLLLRHNFIPAPYSIYKAVRKLNPGTILTVGPGHADTQIHSYWSLKNAFEHGHASPISDPETYVEGLEVRLKRAVKTQLNGDVPVGVYLSGGVDSSIIAALAQNGSSHPTRTYSIGFSDPRYDETSHATAVAGHLKTEHRSLYVSPEHVSDIIPSLSSIYDEPFADSSQIPTCLIARLARNEVKVILSGDGGDELFAGYGRYRMTRARWRLLSSVPAVVRSRVSRRLSAIQAGGASFRQRIQKVARAVGAPDLDSFYLETILQWAHVDGLVADVEVDAPALNMLRPCVSSTDPLRRMMYLDSACYLPDDIMCKVDRSAMAVGLEVRAPLLDREVVEYSCQAPAAVLERGGVAKWPLRRLLAKHVPTFLTDRPKMGFSPPLALWLAGPLRGWAEDLLSESSLVRAGLLNVGPVREIWSEHLSGRHDQSSRLWTVLMLQAWKFRAEQDTPCPVM